MTLNGHFANPGVGRGVKVQVLNIKDFVALV